jgi:hypothetical protein
MALREQELHRFVRLRLARPVGVEIVEEAAGDDAASGAQARNDRIIVATRDDEEELGESEVLGPGALMPR